jgi:hypothetical protein
LYAESQNCPAPGVVVVTKGTVGGGSSLLEAGQAAMSKWGTPCLDDVAQRALAAEPIHVPARDAVAARPGVMSVGALRTYSPTATSSARRGRGARSQRERVGDDSTGAECLTASKSGSPSASVLPPQQEPRHARRAQDDAAVR